jgi:hypothetical protein
MSGTSRASNATDGWFTQSNPAANDQGIGPKRINTKYPKGQPNNQESSYGGKRYVFSTLQKVERVEQLHREKGREFQSAGAVKAKARLPATENTVGTVRVAESDERREIIST